MEHHNTDTYGEKVSGLAWMLSSLGGVLASGTSLCCLTRVSWFRLG